MRHLVGDSNGSHDKPLADRGHTRNKTDMSLRYSGNEETFLSDSEWVIVTDITFNHPDKILEELSTLMMDKMKLPKKQKKRQQIPRNSDKLLIPQAVLRNYQELKASLQQFWKKRGIIDHVIDSHCTRLGHTHDKIYDTIREIRASI